MMARSSSSIDAWRAVAAAVESVVIKAPATDGKELVLEPVNDPIKN
jgi:hypothetical protein